MNTEATLENTAPMTPGQRLRQARETLGLTQQTVAERLCLKVSTVRQLEDDNTPTDLAPTFLRGYIRSYAKLVHVPENELLPVLDKQIIPRIANVASMPSFSLGKPRKKRDGWLMSFTWLVVLVVLGLTGAWWWQNYQVQQQEIHSMVDHAAASAQDLPEDPAGAAADNASQAIDLSLMSPASPVEAPVAESATLNPNAAAASAPTSSAPTATHPTPTVAAPAQAAPVNTNVAASPAPTNPVVDTSAHAIVMTFNADCWLEVVDAAGKKLFSGMQRGGGELSLNGQAPFHLKIGAPAAVQIQYQGKPVDLSRFVRSNQVARLTLAAE